MDASWAVALVLAASEPCGADALAAGPAWIGVGSGEAGPGRADFGQIGGACAATEAALRVRGEAIIDRPDYYGAIAAGATLRGRLRLGVRWTATAAADVATYRFAANAVVESSAAAAGPPTLGVQYHAAPGGVPVAPFLRLLLPLDGARRLGALWGGEAGVASALRLRPDLGLQGGVTLPATLAAVAGARHVALAPTLVAEVAYAPMPWLALAGGAGLRVGVDPGDATELRAVSARGTARAAWGRGWSVALAADLPVAGADRTDATVAVLAAWAP